MHVRAYICVLILIVSFCCTGNCSILRVKFALSARTSRRSVQAIRSFTGACHVYVSSDISLERGTAAITFLRYLCSIRKNTQKHFRMSFLTLVDSISYACYTFYCSPLNKSPLKRGSCVSALSHERRKMDKAAEPLLSGDLFNICVVHIKLSTLLIPGVLPMGPVRSDHALVAIQSPFFFIHNLFCCS